MVLKSFTAPGTAITVKVGLSPKHYGALLRMQREGNHKSISGMIRSILVAVIEDEQTSSGSPADDLTAEECSRVARVAAAGNRERQNNAEMKKWKRGRARDLAVGEQT
jgi:hypothetical protein